LSLADRSAVTSFPSIGGRFISMGVVSITMPDTKAGRERKGRNKRAQLESVLNSRERELLDEPAEPPEPEGIDSEFLTDPNELES